MGFHSKRFIFPEKKSTYTSQNSLWFCLLFHSHSMKFKGLFSNHLWFCGFTPRGSYSLKKINIHFSKPPVVLSSIYGHSMKFKSLFSNRLWFCGFTPSGSCSLKKINIHFSKPPVVLSSTL